MEPMRLQNIGASDDKRANIAHQLLKHVGCTA